jgi:hypothetical protein
MVLGLGSLDFFPLPIHILLLSVQFRLFQAPFFLLGQQVLAALL